MPAVAMPTPTETKSDRIYTLDEFMMMDFDERAELVEGKIKLMGRNNTTHARVVGWLAKTIDNWAEKENWGLVLAGDASIQTKSDPDSGRAADLICISTARYQKVKQKGKVIDLGPELVVEVVSPSNTWNDINDKLFEYFALKTNEVWVVSPDRAMVTVFSSPKSSQSFTAEDHDIVTSQHLPGFELRLTDLADQISRLN